MLFSVYAYVHKTKVFSNMLNQPVSLQMILNSSIVAELLKLVKGS